MHNMAIKNRTTQACKDEINETTVQPPAFRMIIAITHRTVAKDFILNFADNVTQLRSAVVDILRFFSWPQIVVAERKGQWAVKQDVTALGVKNVVADSPASTSCLEDGSLIVWYIEELLNDIGSYFENAFYITKETC